MVAFNALSSFRCIQCGTFETAHDFVLHIGHQFHVRFQLPLCDKCRLYSVLPNQSYLPDHLGFRAFTQLSIVNDLLRIHHHFMEDDIPELCMVL